MLHKQDQEAGPHPRTEFLSLLQFLQAEGLYESAQESLQREEVLGQLNDLVREWVKQVARVLAYDEDAIEAANGRIFTFGSYRLGVHGPGGIRGSACRAVSVRPDGVVVPRSCAAVPLYTAFQWQHSPGVSPDRTGPSFLAMLTLSGQAAATHCLYGEMGWHEPQAWLLWQRRMWEAVMPRQ